MTLTVDDRDLIERLGAQIAEHRAHIAKMEAEYGKGRPIDERHSGIVLNFGDVVRLQSLLSDRDKLELRVRVLSEALEPFTRGPDRTSLAKLYAHLNRVHYLNARAALTQTEVP